MNTTTKIILACLTLALAGCDETQPIKRGPSNEEIRDVVSIEVQKALDRRFPEYHINCTKVEVQKQAENYWFTQATLEYTSYRVKHVNKIYIYVGLNGQQIYWSIPPNSFLFIETNDAWVARLWDTLGSIVCALSCIALLIILHALVKIFMRCKEVTQPYRKTIRQHHNFSMQELAIPRGALSMAACPPLTQKSLSRAKATGTLFASPNLDPRDHY